VVNVSGGAGSRRPKFWPNHIWRCALSDGISEATLSALTSKPAAELAKRGFLIYAVRPPPRPGWKRWARPSLKLRLAACGR